MLIVKNEIEVGNVDRVLHFIQENPGCHLRLIKRELEISIGTVQYHLARLEKIGKITTNRCGLYKYYFPVGVFEKNQKDLLQVLCQETTREILMVIVEQKNPTQKEVVRKIGISSAAINWHTRRLINLNIIYEIREGKYKRYQLKIDHKYIMGLLKFVLDRPGNKEIQLALFYDYQKNLKQYAIWQQYFRAHQPPTLVAWGKNDIFFGPQGALAFQRDIKDVEAHLLNTGHFPLEEDLGVSATLIKRFLSERIMF